MSSTHALVLLSVVLAAGVVLVLAVALIEVRRGLTRISEGLATLRGRARRASSREHLRPLEGAVKAINAQFDIILGALPGIAREGGDRRREEAAMTLWWIGDVVLLVVVLPVVVYLLRTRAERRQEHRPERAGDRDAWRPRGRRTSTPPRCC